MKNTKPSANLRPRQLAVRVLTRVLVDHQALDEAVEEAARTAGSQGLSPSQRGWLLEVCAGVLRWRGRLDEAIDSAALKKKPTGWLRKALWVGTYQLLAQDRAPAPAVVSETVSLIKEHEGEFPAKFANAVLRRIADHAAAWRELDFPPGLSVAAEARRASLPEWLWERLKTDHGLDWAKRFSRAAMERPVIWLRARPGLSVEQEQQLREWCEPGPFADSWKVKEGEAAGLPSRPGFAEGIWFVQDISSQQLVREVARPVLEALGRPSSALDLCSAPGGKAIGLSWEGMEVVATDLSGARFSLLEQNIARTAHRTEAKPVGIGHAEPLVREQAVQGQYGLVWVDAPCSGTGIIRRHPDVRWLKQPKDLVELTRIQGQLLEEAARCVRPGGFLAYSVCSVLNEEGPSLHSALKLPGFKKIQEWSLSPVAAPYGDGFWAVLLRREAS